MAQATHRKPACLPEQLLWTAPAVPPPRASACADGWWIGQCAPHSSALASSPASASIRVAVATCPGSPECEAQASASSSGPKPVAVGGAALDQRQRLQRLHRRARIDRLLDVAQRQHPAAVGIDHRDGAGVPAFHQRAAQDLDQNRDYSSAIRTNCSCHVSVA